MTTYTVNNLNNEVVTMDEPTYISFINNQIEPGGALIKYRKYQVVRWSGGCGVIAGAVANQYTVYYCDQYGNLTNDIMDDNGNLSYNQTVATVSNS